MTDAMTDAPAVVLVVDDDEAKRYLLVTWLRRAGHTVIEAGTGREALEKVSAAELVLLDVNLPDVSGYEVRAGKSRATPVPPPSRWSRSPRPRWRSPTAPWA